jgi:hypothetical protein
MYEIPKIATHVDLNLINDETIPGSFFITEDRISPAGDPDIEEFLNKDPDLFFSFESDAGAYRLINKMQIISIETDQDDVEVKQQTPLAPRPLVLHFRNDTTLYGMVFPTLAEESRVSDILNQNSDFITMYRQSQKIIVNRHQIVYVNAN